MLRGQDTGPTVLRVTNEPGVGPLEDAVEALPRFGVREDLVVGMRVMPGVVARGCEAPSGLRWRKVLLPERRLPPPTMLVAVQRERMDELEDGRGSERPVAGEERDRRHPDERDQR